MKCKYCGSSVAESDVSVTRFGCESYVNGGEWTQSPDCMADELRTLRALRDKVDASGTCWATDTHGRMDVCESEDAALLWGGGRAVLCKLVPVEYVK